MTKTARETPFAFCLKMLYLCKSKMEIVLEKGLSPLLLGWFLGDFSVKIISNIVFSRLLFGEIISSVVFRRCIVLSRDNNFSVLKCGKYTYFCLLKFKKMTNF